MLQKSCTVKKSVLFLDTIEDASYTKPALLLQTNVHLFHSVDSDSGELEISLVEISIRISTIENFDPLFKGCNHCFH